MRAPSRETAPARSSTGSFLWRQVSGYTTGAVTRFSGEILYSVASVLSSVVALAANVIAARALAPEALGIMQTLMLIPAYCTFLQLGVFNGLNRNIAFYLGREDHAKVGAMVNSSWAVAKLAAALGAFVAVAFAIYYLMSASPGLYLAGTLFVLFGLGLEPFSQHMEVVFLSSKNFRALARVTYLQNFITVGASFLPLVAGAPGFIASRCIYYLARFLPRWRHVPIAADGAGSVGEAKELAITGLPLLGAGVLYAYFGVADRSVIACFLRPEDLGHYSLATIVVTGTQFIPFCLAAMFYPRLAACYGRTGSPRSLRRYFWILLGTNIALVLPICAVTYFSVGPLTEHFLPEYVDGIPAARVASLASLGFMYIGVGGIIAVIRKNTPYLIAIAVALGAVWLLGGHWATQGHGILGVVWARALATALLCVFTVLFAFRLTSKST